MDNAVDATFDSDYDPYLAKVVAHEQKREQLLAKFAKLTEGSRVEIRDTAVVHQIIHHQVTFGDKDMMKVLRLSKESPIQVSVYTELLRHVRHAATHLLYNVDCDSLAKMPMTDLRRICYRIADRFDKLFYAPPDSQAESLIASALFLWKDRYNSMWPVLSMLVREYARAKENLRDP